MYNEKINKVLGFAYAVSLAMMLVGVELTKTNAWVFYTGLGLLTALLIALAIYSCFRKDYGKMALLLIASIVLNALAVVVMRYDILSILSMVNQKRGSFVSFSLAALLPLVFITVVMVNRNKPDSFVVRNPHIVNKIFFALCVGVLMLIGVGIYLL